MSSAMYEDDDEEERERMTAEEAEEMMKRPDFMMEGNVGSVVETYLSNGGAMDTAVETLSAGYVGYAQMCNVLSVWLAELGEPEAAPAAPSTAGASARRSSLASPLASPRSSADSSLPDEEAAAAVSANDCIESTMCRLISAHFQPAAADRIFEAEGVGIDWLPTLIAHKPWRSVVYELTEQHPSCLMLNFAVKLISDAGFQHEIASVNTASQQLEIFSRVLLSSLDQLLEQHSKGMHSAAYEKAFGELERVVCQSEHTYLYAVALLEKVLGTEKGAGAAACQHIVEQLRIAAKAHLQETTALRCFMLQSSDDQISSQVVQALLTMTSKGELNPADITHIYEQYIMPRPPPLEILRDPVLIDMLVDSLFNYNGSKVNVEHRDKYVYLLAYANAVSESSRPGGQRSQTRNELEPTRSALDQCVCSLDSGEDQLTGELPSLLQAARTPAVAAGLLHYLDTMFRCETRIGDPVPASLVLLDHVSSVHPNLQSRAFTVCCRLYDRVSEDVDAAEFIMERQRCVVDRLVHLVSVGAALPVLERVTQWLRDGRIDASLVRYAVLEVLDMIAPPYSRDLVRLLLPLVLDADVFDKAMQDKTPAVVEFIAASAQMMD